MLASRNQSSSAQLDPDFPGEGEDGRARVVIENVSPAVDLGHSRVKRVRGDVLRVEADLLVDGHDQVAGLLLWRDGPTSPFSETPLTPVGNGSDRWGASFPLDEIGLWQYTIEAWVDGFATWRWGLGRKAEAGRDVALELVEGAALVAAAAARAAANPADIGAADLLRQLSRDLAAETPQVERVALAQGGALVDLMRRWPDRSAARRLQPALEVIVDPVRARFSSWYELFPRSTGAAGRHGTFRDAEARLAYVKDMGFDIVYLPPIHPIGRAHRKGPNNSLVTAAGDPGSPWAIGAAEGGHKAVHPELGTLAEFRRFVDSARALEHRRRAGHRVSSLARPSLRA